MAAVSRSLSTADGLTLQAELAIPGGAPRAAAVLCHPHPQYGGTMRSIVIGALFEALPAAGVTCLRFNFRGVEQSTGIHDHGRGELLDVRAAVAALAAEIPAAVPLVLAGWSFGADMALSTVDDRLAGWLAIAPPLRFAADLGPVAADPRPKQLVLGQHDEFRDPASVVEATEDWVATEIEVIAGASHFFVGRTDRVVAAAQSFVDRVGPATNSTLTN
jgi:alpha/beta superfamily hydrolase